jgi:hypothetical protein
VALAEQPVGDVSGKREPRHQDNDPPQPGGVPGAEWPDRAIRQEGQDRERDDRKASQRLYVARVEPADKPVELVTQSEDQDGCGCSSKRDPGAAEACQERDSAGEQRGYGGGRVAVLAQHTRIADYEDRDCPGKQRGASERRSHGGH